MQGYLWIIWVKLAGALWIIGGKIRQSLIFYFVAIDDPLSMIRDKCMPKPILASNYLLFETKNVNKTRA